MGRMSKRVARKVALSTIASKIEQEVEQKNLFGLYNRTDREQFAKVSEAMMEIAGELWRKREKMDQVDGVDI